MSCFKGELTRPEGFRVWPDFHVAFRSVSLSADSVVLEPVPLTLEGHQYLSLVRGHSTLRDPICCLPLCAVSQGLCSLSAPGKQERAELHAVLRTKIMGKSTCLDSLQWLSSVTLYLKDYPFYCNWWNFILFNGWVIILLKIYKHAFLQIKYPCFTQDLGPLRPSSCRLQSPSPGLWRPWQITTLENHFSLPCQVEYACIFYNGFQTRNNTDAY